MQQATVAAPAAVTGATVVAVMATAATAVTVAWMAALPLHRMLLLPLLTRPPAPTHVAAVCALLAQRLGVAALLQLLLLPQAQMGVKPLQHAPANPEPQHVALSSHRSGPTFGGTRVRSTAWHGMAQPFFPSLALQHLLVLRPPDQTLLWSSWSPAGRRHVTLHLRLAAAVTTCLHPLRSKWWRLRIQIPFKIWGAGWCCTAANI